MGEHMRRSGIIEHRHYGYLMVFILFATPTTLQAKWLTIHNDFFQCDLDGNPVQTRSGCLSKFGETYYWYGCDRAMTNQTCYSSTDLLHWKNEGNMLTASRGTNRMDVIYNDSTKKYVMIMKWETPGSEWCNRGIATSESPTGPFTKMFDSTVYGANTGDMSVFQDDDGKAYYCWEIWNNGNTSQALALMTWDYIGLEKKIQSWSNSDREANCIMKRRGLYYYLTSKMVGIDPSETQYWTAPKIDGPWTTRLVPIIAPGDGDRNSWDTQVDFVFAFKGTEDTVQMYCGDRWVKPHPERNGDYVWLPITFTQRDSVVINYYQDWEVEPDLGLWRPLEDERNLALNKTATASSTSGGNSANNVTSPATWRNYYNTKWVSASSDPQWIAVDLGSAMPVNRVILKWDDVNAKSFKIQVSTDNETWTDVFSTTKGGKRSVTDETFPTTTARYVRMNGTERGSTNGGYSLFDFMILNDSVTTPVTFQQENSRVPLKPLLTCRENIIHYSVSASCPVKIDVVDCRGKRAAVLIDGFKHAGDHETVLPDGLVSGTYIIRLSTGAKKLSVREVVLMR
jgi:hypothetical protein